MLKGILKKIFNSKPSKDDVSSFVYNAKNGDNIKVTAFIDKYGTEAINMKTYYGWTALTGAISGGQGSTVGILLEKGANVNSRKDDDTTELMLAVSRGEIGITAMLLQKGADVNMKDDKGETALMKATSLGREVIVSMLLGKKADITAKNGSGKTALMLAATKGRTAIVESLLENGADANAEDNFGMTARMLADREGMKNTVLFIDRCSTQLCANEPANQKPLSVKFSTKS